MDDQGLEDLPEMRPTGPSSGSGAAPSRYPGREMDRPRELSPAERAMAQDQAGAEAVPTLEPPGAIRGASAAGGWQRNRKVVALWANDQGRNSWLYILGSGWLRLAGTSDSALVALSVLGAHARQSQADIDYRTETDGLVHEIYVW